MTDFSWVDYPFKNPFINVIALDNKILNQGAFILK